MIKDTPQISPYKRLAEFIEDWKFFLRREGIKSSLPRIVREIAQLPYRHLRFFILARSLSEPLPDVHPKIDLQILPFHETNLEQIWTIDRPSMAKLCARRLALGQKGLMAFHQKMPVGYAWGCTEVFPQLERVPIKLEVGDVLCTDVYTAPPFRGMGIQTALSLARFRLFRELGFQRAICYIEIRNAPSLGVWQRKLEGQVVGCIDFKRVGTWYRMRCFGPDAMQKLVK